MKQLKQTILNKGKQNEYRKLQENPRVLSSSSGRGKLVKGMVCDREEIELAESF